MSPREVITFWLDMGAPISLLSRSRALRCRIRLARPSSASRRELRHPREAGGLRMDRHAGVAEQLGLPGKALDRGVRRRAVDIDRLELDEGGELRELRSGDREVSIERRG